MATNVTLNNVTYSIPAEGDSDWGTNVTNYLIALSTGVLQKSGGTFTLTAEVNFGATYGIKSAYIKSLATNPASAGFVRLGNTESIKWRNAANSADLDLTVNASNALQFGGTSLTLSGSIVNADINAAAAIALSKLAALTVSRALVSDGSGVISVSAATSTEVGYLSGVTSAIQTQLNGKQATGSYALTTGKLSQFAATTSAELAGVISDETGSGSLVFATSPTLVTPNIGAATATSVNSTTIPTSKTLVVTTDKLSALAATTSAELAGVISDETGSGALVFGTSPVITTPDIDILSLQEQGSTPTTPASGKFKIYPKTDGLLYTLNDAGSENLVGDLPSGSQSYEISNLSIACSVGSNALTIAVKTKSGSDASAPDPITVGFRNSTLTNGTYNTRTITGALSMVVSSGSTLGHTSTVAHNIYVYLIDNAGTVEVAVSQSLYGEGSVISTTAEGGAGAADSNSTIYSTTARSNVPIRLIGKLISTQTTAGTWAAVPSTVQVGDYGSIAAGETVACRYLNNAGTAIPNTDTVMDFATKDYDTHNAVTTGSGFKFTAPISGIYRIRGKFIINVDDTLATFFARIYMNGTTTKSTVAEPKEAINTYHTVVVEDEIRMLAGEYVQILLSENVDTAGTLTSASGDNVFTALKVGNY